MHIVDESELRDVATRLVKEAGGVRLAGKQTGYATNTIYNALNPANEVSRHRAILINLIAYLTRGSVSTQYAIRTTESSLKVR